METKELLFKLELIEEQARLALEETPQQRIKERQRMIIAVLSDIKAAHDPDATVSYPETLETR